MIPALDVLSPPIREARPDDAAFVAATFSEQLSRGRHHDAHEIVNRVLDSKRVKVLVSVEDNYRLNGWLIYVPTPRVRALVFAYVRNKQRLNGLGRAMAAQAWPDREGRWVHAGLRGGSTSSLLRRFPSTEVLLEEML